MKVAIIPIVISAFGSITKGLLKWLEDVEVGELVENIQTTALMRRAESWEEYWRLEETCCHSNYNVCNYIFVYFQTSLELPLQICGVWDAETACDTLKY